MTFFKNPKTLKELKTQYKELIKRYHPDLGGSNKAMITINLEYEELFKTLQNKTTNKAEKKEDINEYKNLIQKLIKFKDITIEIVGNWIWVGGKTYPIKDQLKKLGFNWSKGWKKWAYIPGGKKLNRRKYKTGEKKAKDLYGCKKIKIESEPTLVLT